MTEPRTFQPEQHDEMMDLLSALSPHGVTVTNADGTVTVTSEDDRTMTATETHDGWACTDCSLLIANGETPPDMTEDETVAFLDRIGTDVRWGWGRSDEEEDQYFSWSSCDVCGSHLGGSRHGVHCWEI